MDEMKKRDDTIVCFFLLSLRKAKKDDAHQSGREREQEKEKKER
jgi:hypothetical protein